MTNRVPWVRQLLKLLPLANEMSFQVALNRVVETVFDLATIAQEHRGYNHLDKTNAIGFEEHGLAHLTLGQTRNDWTAIARKSSAEFRPKRPQCAHVPRDSAPNCRCRHRF